MLEMHFAVFVAAAATWSASMTALTDTIRKNAENAKMANQLSQTAALTAEQGGDVVSKVLSTMTGIQESSKQIADIIGVIEDIAFQTNLLALNAAVEAGRSATAR